MIHLRSFQAAALLLAAAAVSGCESALTSPGAAGEGSAGRASLPPVTVVVEAPATSLFPGDSFALRAVALNPAGNPVPAQAAWSSSSDDVATVSAEGVVTAVAPGEVTITAVVAGQTGSVRLTVASPSGALLVTVETVGDLPDPDGYEITRDGEPAGRVGVNGSLRMDDLEPGTYSVALQGASIYCAVDGDVVRTAAVQGGETTTVAFRVECRRNGVAYLWTEDRFETGRQLWVHFPGGGSHRLTTGVDSRRPSWSPEGRRIAFAGDPFSNAGIFVAHLDGGPVQRLTTRRGVTPAWSPDGSKLVFFSAGDLWEISIDGTGERILWQATPFSDSQVPTWSPDGSRIAFKRSNFLNQTIEIVTIAADGSDLRVVRQIGAPAYSHVTWSPDGSRLLYDEPEPGTRSRVYTAEVATGARTLVYQMSDMDLRSSTYTRDGKIAFESFPTFGGPGHHAIWTVNPDGTGAAEFELPGGVSNAAFPTWQ